MNKSIKSIILILGISTLFLVGCGNKGLNKSQANSDKKSEVNLDNKSDSSSDNKPNVQVQENNLKKDDTTKKDESSKASDDNTSKDKNRVTLNDKSSEFKTIIIHNSGSSDPAQVPASDKVRAGYRKEVIIFVSNLSKVYENSNKLIQKLISLTNANDFSKASKESMNIAIEDALVAFYSLPAPEKNPSNELLQSVRKRVDMLTQCVYDYQSNDSYSDDLYNTINNAVKENNNYNSSYKSDVINIIKSHGLDYKENTDGSFTIS